MYHAVAVAPRHAVQAAIAALPLGCTRRHVVLPVPVVVAAAVTATARPPSKVLAFDACTCACVDLCGAERGRCASGRLVTSPYRYHLRTARPWGLFRMSTSFAARLLCGLSKYMGVRFSGQHAIGLYGHIHGTNNPVTVWYTPGGLVFSPSRAFNAALSATRHRQSSRSGTSSSCVCRSVNIV